MAKTEENTSGQKHNNTVITPPPSYMPDMAPCNPLCVLIYLLLLLSFLVVLQSFWGNNVDDFLPDLRNKAIYINDQTLSDCVHVVSNHKSLLITI